MNPTELAISFYHDVNSICTALIQAVGLKYTQARPNLDDPLLRWLDFTRRYIPPEPRNVEISKRLPRVLPPDIERAYIKLIGKIRLGHDVNSYQGRGLIDFHDTSGNKRQERTDLLFADWGIHHLHLTPLPAAEGKFFSERSSWLLFAIFLPGFAGLIDIRPHGEELVFANHELIVAVAERWPDFMARYRVNFGDGVLVSQRPISAADTHLLRKGGVTSFVQIAGRIYMGPGMGITTASTSGQTSMDMIKARSATKSLAEMIEQKDSQFAIHARNHSVADPEYCLSITQRGLSVFEAKSNTAFLLPRKTEHTQASALTQLHELLLPTWALGFLDHAAQMQD